MAAPFVSCILPTRDRRAFLGQAIWYFLRQDYPDRELIIVADGADDVADLVPADPRIHYHWLATPTSLATKRNLACVQGRGTLIAHWDDDDWYAPSRLRQQVEALLASEADVCGAGEILGYALEMGVAWAYAPPVTERPWLVEATWLYRRTLWAAQPFADGPAGDGAAFLAAVPAERLYALPDSRFYLALLHSGNSQAPTPPDVGWEPQPLDEVSRRLGADRDFYVALRSGQPVAHATGPATVTVAAPFLIYDGYGSMAEYLVRGMVQAGATVNVTPLSLDRTGLDPTMQALLDHTRPVADAPVVYFCPPRADLVPFLGHPALFINTMWESSRLPAAWPAQLNQARAVIVPTRFVAAVCRASGVTVPVVVVPEGIDPAIYHYEARPVPARA